LLLIVSSLDRQSLINESAPHNPPNRGIFPAGLHAPLFIGVSVGVTSLGNGMQEGGK
jgi:hypothetical protein